MNSKYFGRLICVVLLTISYLGCSSGPSRVLPPSIDADDAASRAMEMYDTDGDGFIAGEELEGVPALNSAMETLDADGDDKISESEIQARIKSWQKTMTGISSISCEVKLNGQPLEGATVTFEPAGFLSEELQVASDVTNSWGRAIPSIPKEKRPSADTPSGIQLGLFRVKISKMVDGKETLPAKYNTETTLGQQVAPDDPAVLRRNVVFDLKSS